MSCSLILQNRDLELQFLSGQSESQLFLWFALHTMKCSSGNCILSFYQKIQSVKIQPSKCFLHQEYLAQLSQTIHFVLKKMKKGKKKAAIC